MNLPLHVRAGIHEAWLVDPPKETTEIHSRLYDDRYRETVGIKRGEAEKPRTILGLEVAAAILG